MASRSPSLPAAPSVPRRVTRSTATALRVDDASMELKDSDSASQASVGSLDEPLEYDYQFKPNEPVWIFNNNKWTSGRIFYAAPKVRPSDNLPCWNVLYQDAFGHKLRKYFAPLLGELKPDTARVRQMLKEARWI
ncbi:hypothetical protein C8F01DRAFT_1260236 [Mycena amicta]|nr:hypothetical protein C8F01DRAFT_1260236 [Mycena amicta]